jgi:hypothetical protein
MFGTLKGVIYRARTNLRGDTGNYREGVWFSRLFRAAEETRFSAGKRLDEAKDIEKFLKVTCAAICSGETMNSPERQLWATEFHALYLERLASLFGDSCDAENCSRLLAQAGEAYKKAGKLSKGLESRKGKSVADTFAAAMWVRAGYCLRDTDRVSAICCFHRVADLMSFGPSILAKDYYALANAPDQQGPRLPAKHDVPTAKGRSIAIIANEFDIVFADRLVATFEIEKISSEIYDSRSVNLDKVAREHQGIVIVGDIRAPHTDLLVRHLPKDVEISAEDSLSVQTRAIAPPQPVKKVVKFRLRGQLQVPVCILAGGSRVATCQKVVDFSEQLDEDNLIPFVKAVQEQRMS